MVEEVVATYKSSTELVALVDYRSSVIRELARLLLVEYGAIDRDDKRGSARPDNLRTGLSAEEYARRYQSQTHWHSRIGHTAGHRHVDALAVERNRARCEWWEEGTTWKRKVAAIRPGEVFEPILADDPPDPGHVHRNQDGQGLHWGPAEYPDQGVATPKGV